MSLHTKYRPSTFEDVLGHSKLIKSLKKVVTDRRAKAFVFTGPSGCVDGDTEYLSPTGWVRIADYTGGPVTQFNLDGSAELILPTAYIKKPNTEFFHFKTKYGIDQMLSAEHRVLYITTKRNWAVKSAAEVALQQQRNKCGFPGTFQTIFKPKTLGTLSLNDDELKVMVAFIADGSLLPARAQVEPKRKCYYQPKRCRECNAHFTPTNSVAQHCRNCRRWWGCIGLKRPRKIARLHKLLKAAKIEYVVYKKKAGYTTFYFNPPIRTKTYGSEFWGCSITQLCLIASELKYWDGRCGSKYPNVYTCDKRIADFAQYAITAYGYRASIQMQNRKGHIEYYVGGTPRTDVGLGTSKVVTVPANDGFKYCFEVPSSYLVLRRGGNIFITGNTGKTTLARILANQFAGGKATQTNIEEIDAASHSGADDMRSVVNHAYYKAIGESPVKSIIVDEAHRLSAAAWTILLKPIEEPPQHVFWFFCTTEAGKIPKTIMTRCLRYDLKPVSEEDILELLIKVADAEKLNVKDEVLEAIAEGAQGSPRQALIYLEASIYAETAADARNVMRTAGQSKEVVDLCRFLLKNQGRSWVECMKYVSALEGIEAESIRIVIVNYLTAVLKGAKSDKAAAALLALMEPFLTPYQATSDKHGPLLHSLGLALQLERSLFT